MFGVLGIMFSHRQDDDDVTIMDVVIESPSKNIMFGNLGEVRLDEAGNMTTPVTVDWGDGTPADSWNTVYMSNKTPCVWLSSSGVSAVHTYENAGTYRIRIKGASLVSFQIFYNSASVNTGPVVKYVKFAKTIGDGSAWTSSSFGNQMTTPILEEIDASETDFISCIVLATSTSRNNSIKIVRVPKTIKYLAQSFCRCFDALEDVYFDGLTMSGIRSIKTTATGSVLWNFTNFPQTATLHCSDGDIRYVNGEWTDFPN